MAKFNYKARDNSGKTTEGMIEAANKQQVFELLKKYNLLATQVVEKKESSLPFKIPFLERIPFKEKVIFSRQLATMIDAGLSIVQSLKILAEQEKVKNKKFAEIIEELAADIEGGLSFSASLKKHPKVFTPIYTSLVESGEASGNLDDVLNRIAEQMEADYDLKGKIRGAMMYPSFIIVAMLVAGVIVLTFVIPQLKSLFEESGAELPWVTRLLLAISDFLVNYWYIALGGVVALVVGSRVFLKSEQGRQIWDMFKIRMPIFGNFIQNIYMVRFTRTLGTLISAGLPILDSLKIVSDTVGNVHYKKEISAIAKRVEGGANLSQPLKESKLFPTMVSHMSEVGEKTGNLDTVLSKLAKFFDKEVTNTVSTISTMIEPIILVIIGIGVGIFVGAVLLPIYQLASTM